MWHSLLYKSVDAVEAWLAGGIACLAVADPFLDDAAYGVKGSRRAARRADEVRPRRLQFGESAGSAAPPAPPALLTRLLYY